MEETKFHSEEIVDLMKKIEAENAGQERYARKQYRMACVSAAANVLVLVVVLVCVAVLMPRVMDTFTQVETVLENLESVTTELTTLVPQLSKSVPELIGNLDTLVNTSSEEITTALQKISSLDVDSLNTAIRDLKSVVEPLARLFGK